MKKFLIIYSCLITAIFFVFCIGTINKSADSIDKDLALQECVEAVATKCAPVISYASELEKENARLNRLYKECKINKDKI